MTSVICQIVLKELGVMEQDIGCPAPPELIIMAAIPIGGLRRDSVTPRVEEYFHVLISPDDYFELILGPIVEVHPAGERGYSQGLYSPHGIVLPEIVSIKVRLKEGGKGF